MASQSGLNDQPPPYEEVEALDEVPLTETLEPAVLVLAGQTVQSGYAGDPPAPLYQLNQDVTTLTHKGPTVSLERIDSVARESAEGKSRREQENRHIFFLAHPKDAVWQTDVPAYYVTSVPPQGIGNVSFQTSKPVFQKMVFRALLSAGRSAWDDPLFDEEPQPLFEAKAKLTTSGRYTWTDAKGGVVATEDEKDGHHRLAVAVPLQRELRDALVALWCLRLWHDSAESKQPSSQLKREAMNEMTISSQNDWGMKLNKRVGALGAAGAGA